MRALAWLTALPLVFAPPLHAQGRDIAVEGIAPVGTDPGRARRAAIGDALRQALMQAGLELEARSLVDRNVIRTDSLWATAKGRVTGYQLVDEWQDSGLLHVSITASVETIEERQCSADPLPATHLGAVRLDVDGAVDPAITGPLLADLDHVLRGAFAGDRWDVETGPAPRPLAVAWRSSERYAALAYGGAPANGVFVRPYVKLIPRAVAGLALVKGQRLEAEFGLELVDAARGQAIGRVSRRAGWTLAARAWEYLPADYRPDRRIVAPDVRDLLVNLVEDARHLLRCRPVAVGVAGQKGDELFLDGGSDAGLRPGDLLGVGGSTAQASGGLDWPLAEVVSVTNGSAHARLLGDQVVQSGGTVVRLR